MKLFCAFIISLWMSTIVCGQAGDNDLSPDFTATDINGQTYNLYELLDEGKTVILDFIGLYCGPCWRDHESGKLKNFYDNFGPSGTDEVVVFMVESDPNSGLEDLYGANGTGLGDWVTGTPYPILNDHNIRPLYHVIGYPSYYKICPSRKIEQIFVSLMEQEDFAPLLETCNPLEGNVNLGLHDFHKLEKVVCGIIPNTDLQVILHNKGLEPITSAVLELSINGEAYETKMWTGNLDPFYFDYLTFVDAPLNVITNFEVEITEVNGAIDDQVSDNSINTEFKQSESTEYQQLILHLDTDEKGAETYWQLWSDSGSLIEKSSAGDYKRDSSYYIPLNLPEEGCYDFILYDIASDGLSKNGKASVYDIKGKLLGEIGSGFGFFETRSIELKGNKKEELAASIYNLEGVPADFCLPFDLRASFQLMNLGTSTLSSALISVKINEMQIESFLWNGSLLPSQSEKLSMTTYEISESSDLKIEIEEINGTSFENFQVVLEATTNSLEANQTLILDLETDDYACELFWQCYSSTTGEIIASGGNPNVVPGPNLELEVPHISCQDAFYEDNKMYQELISIPVDDCYVFEIMDHYGDGLGFGGSWSLTNVDGKILVNGQQEFSKLVHHFRVAKAVSVEPFVTIEEIGINPNPSTGKLVLENISNINSIANLEIFLSTGQRLESKLLAPSDFSKDQLSLDLTSYAKGVYFVKIVSDSKHYTGKFVLIN